MSASTTQLRTALQELLAGAYGFPFVGGRLDPPQEDRAIGCVWHPGKRWWARDGHESEVFYSVRVFPILRVPQGTTTDAPHIDTLEEQEELLERTIGPVLVSLPAANGHHMFVLNEVSIDLDGQFVEGQIRAWQQNLSGLGG